MPSSPAAHLPQCDTEARNEASMFVEVDTCHDARYTVPLSGAAIRARRRSNGEQAPHTIVAPVDAVDHVRGGLLGPVIGA